MSFSDETINLILDIKEYSNGKIKNDFELSVLFESGYFTDKRPLFEELIFKAKFLNGMLNILSGNPGQDQMEKLMPEFAKNLEDLTNLMKEIVGTSGEGINKIFREKYFVIKPEVIKELTFLVMDLAACKDYFNERRYTKD
jgi:hypothetical protein